MRKMNKPELYIYFSDLRKWFNTVNKAFSQPFPKKYSILIDPVDSGGRLLNNLGGPVPDKLAFIRKYRFTLAMEKKSQEGYTTEKIYEPRLMQSIPVYWGNTRIREEFNPANFINVADFGSMREAAAYIVALDNDPE